MNDYKDAKKYMEYKFIVRTKKLLKQYENMLNAIRKNDKKKLKDIKQNYKKYDVALLLNCLLALIVLPKANDKILKKIPDDIAYNEHDNEHKKKLKNLIGNLEISQCKIKRRKEITPKDIVVFMRNSVAHMDLEVLSEKGEIAKIIFKDRRNKPKPNISEIAISKDDLRTFVEHLAGHLTGGGK